jgi:hypothetical protein
MTPEQEATLLEETAEEIERLAAAAFAEYRRLVIGGMAPRDAVAQVMQTFTGEFAGELAAAFTAITGASVGTASVLALTVGTVTLSQRLYADAQELGGIVQGIVNRHAAGFQDARALALTLYEGYGFNPVEVLKFSKANDLIPKYLREALLPDLAGNFETIFARIQVGNMTTPALRAAYAELLAAIEALKDGAGDELLTRKLRVAFEEKARYLANRIAQTELHRAYAERQAAELMADGDVEFVQWRLSASHPREDICDYFAEVDRYGLGPGVYPKAVAPVPLAHPFCRCVLAPRLDLTGEKARERRGADTAYFRSMDPADAARVAGSAAKLDAILSGSAPIDVHNAGRPEQYQVRSVATVADEYSVRT